MALTETHLRAAGELLAAAPSLREAAAQWRAQHPQVRALLLDAADLRSETPVLRAGGRALYLVASSGHCWHVTQRPEDADALILSQE